MAFDDRWACAVAASSALAIAFVLVGGTPTTRAQDAAAQPPTSLAEPESGSASRPEEDTVERSGYKEAVSRGLDEFERANYIEARANLLEAHRIWPNARTLRGLGYCEFELKNYPASVKLLQEALASRVRTLSGQMRVDAQELLERARSYVAVVAVLTNPRDAQVLIDGLDVSLDAENRTELAVGSHSLEVRAPNYHSARRELQVESRFPQTVQIDLVSATQPTHDGGPRSDAPPLLKKWWLWTSVGALVAAGVVTGLVVGLRDRGEQSPLGGSERTTIKVGMGVLP